MAVQADLGVPVKWSLGSTHNNQVLAHMYQASSPELQLFPVTPQRSRPRNILATGELCSHLTGRSSQHASSTHELADMGLRVRGKYQFPGTID